MHFRVFESDAVLFTPCQYILLFVTVIKGIIKTIFNYLRTVQYTSQREFTTILKRSAPKYLRTVHYSTKREEHYSTLTKKGALQYLEGEVTDRGRGILLVLLGILLLSPGSAASCPTPACLSPPQAPDFTYIQPLNTITIFSWLPPAPWPAG